MYTKFALILDRCLLFVYDRCLIFSDEKFLVKLFFFNIKTRVRVKIKKVEIAYSRTPIIRTTWDQTRFGYAEIRIIGYIIHKTDPKNMKFGFPLLLITNVPRIFVGRDELFRRYCYMKNSFVKSHCYDTGLLLAKKFVRATARFAPFSPPLSTHLLLTVVSVTLEEKVSLMKFQPNRIFRGCTFRSKISHKANVKLYMAEIRRKFKSCFQEHLPSNSNHLTGSSSRASPAVNMQNFI